MNDTLESISQEMYNKSYKDLIYRVDGEVEGGERQRTVQLELCRRENVKLRELITLEARIACTVESKLQEAEAKLEQVDRIIQNHVAWG